MNIRHLGFILFFTTGIALATPAEETTTLAAPIAAPTVSSTRISGDSKVAGGPRVITSQGCTSCATASPTWLEGTVTYLTVGVTNSLGPNRTNVSGYAVTVGGKPAECAVRPLDLRQYVIDAAIAGAGDPVARAYERVVNVCLGGR